MKLKSTKQLAMVIIVVMKREKTVFFSSRLLRNDLAGFLRL